MWGYEARAEEIDFQWPTNDEIEKMTPDVTLKSLTFKSKFGAISSVQIRLNHATSKFFEKQSNRHEHKQTIEFIDVGKVRAISANEFKIKNSGCIRKIEFMGVNESQTVKYDPYNHKYGQNK